MRPRAFGHLDMNKLPVTYTNSRKAWMTSGIFSSWLNSFNDKMKAQHRNVLLFLDNAPSHPTLDLSNVKLVFFPPNTTSVLQPMDQGVIQSLKLQYRKAQFAYMISEMEKDKGSTGTELMKKVNILNAVNWVAQPGGTLSLLPFRNASTKQDLRRMKMTSTILMNQLNQYRLHLTSSASLSWHAF